MFHFEARRHGGEAGSVRVTSHWLAIECPTATMERLSRKPPDGKLQRLPTPYNRRHQAYVNLVVSSCWGVLGKDGVGGL